MKTGIYTLTSELHDESAVQAVTEEFLSGLGIEYDFKGADYTDFGAYALNLIFVRTGGTEGIFKKLLPQLETRYGRPYYLLTSGKSNSLAASMEILSYLNQQGIKGEIIHGDNKYVHDRIESLCAVNNAVSELRGHHLGIIGEPSDWLISSTYDNNSVINRLGIQLVKIGMQELLSEIEKQEEPQCEETSDNAAVMRSLPGALRIYNALRRLVDTYQLDGLTIRCFDLLTAVKNTGCLALAKLNSEGIVGGCEGDLPTMLTMQILQSLTGKTGFQANPSQINPETGEMLFAHCTIPFNMVERYEYDTHFESGIGVGIHGEMPLGGVTIFKVSGDLSRCFVEEGTLVSNQKKSDLCRSQIVVKLDDPSKTSYFLTHPIGNHHVIINGRYKRLIEDFFATI